MRNNKGFTTLELLIVVAIIAILTAIAIPIFTRQLNKARIAVDQANVRSAKAIIMANIASGDAEYNKVYYYDAKKGELASTTEDIEGYGQYTNNDMEDVIGATGYPNHNGTANYLSISIETGNIFSARWE